MDIQALRNKVFERTGLRIDTDDPIFALVALNEAVIEHFNAQYETTSLRNSAQLIKNIEVLAGLCNRLTDAARDLSSRVDEVHLAAALKAANTAKDAVDSDLRRSIDTHLGEAIRRSVRAVVAQVCEEQVKAQAAARRAFVKRLLRIYAPIATSLCLMLFAAQRIGIF
jgi:hypothetical protein